MARTLIPTTVVTPAKATVTTGVTDPDGDLTFTAKRGGSWGNAITVEYVDPGTPDELLSVHVDGFAITVNLATDGSSVVTTTAVLAAAKIVTDEYAQQLVDVVQAGDGTGLLEAMSPLSLAGGDYAVTQPAATAADATADHYITGNVGDTELEVTNATGSSVTVTVHWAAVAATPTDPEVVTVPDGTTRLLGPFPKALHNQNADGDVYIDPSVTSASLTFRAKRVPRAT